MPGLVLLAALCIAAVPLAALGVLAASGAAAPAAAFAAMVPVALAALGLALLWAHDIAAVAASLRRAAWEGAAPESGGASGGASGAGGGQPVLPPMTALAAGIGRLSGILTERAAQLGRLRRTDAVLVESLPEPLIVLGADRAVRRANAAARSAYGADLGAVLRHPLLRGAIDRALAGGGAQGAAARGAAQSADLSLPVPVPREVQATVTLLDPPLADGGRLLVLLSDRTRERAVERMRADFVANAGHELRTPLASLIGFIDTLRGPAADDRPAQERFLGIMAEQAARMNRLIDDLLSLSRIEMTEHQAPEGTADLAALLPRIAAGFEPRLEARRMTLDLRIAPGLAPVPGDADQLGQVVQNLLDNAVKYGREGGTVRLTAAPAAVPPAVSPWPPAGVVVAVEDDGQGIPRRHLPRLTERFYRVDAGRSRAVGGTGLGLAIVKHVVNRHRGQLRIESEEGRGSVFSVWLPAGRAAGRDSA